MNLDEGLSTLYKVKQFNIGSSEKDIDLGSITEKDKFLAAKQILLGISILYILTLLAYIVRPTEGSKLLDICTTIFPPLATLILVSYFRDRENK